MVLADQAVALNPGSATVWFLSGFIKLRAGKLDLAIEHLETSMRLDPIGPHRAGLIGYIGFARFLQCRFSEAVQLLRESAQQNQGPIFQAVLAACFGHLGQSDTAQAALIRYRTLTPQPVGKFARMILTDPAHLTLFLDGIALAEGKPMEPSTP